MFLNYMKKASPHSLTEVPCQSTKGLHYLVLPSSFKKAYSDIITYLAQLQVSKRCVGACKVALKAL